MVVAMTAKIVAMGKDAATTKVVVVMEWSEVK